MADIASLLTAQREIITLALADEGIKIAIWKAPQVVIWRPVPLIHEVREPATSREHALFTGLEFGRLRDGVLLIDPRIATWKE